ncbi:unnamed protein product [Peronospora destructor]|uniref:PH domain-containing protein n=1 Tax=Peronospora destructor TaxID=86335 RepID=A0AAV0VA83_9STRA|nr:unnamed protein product [Peronospora destructor]
MHRGEIATPFDRHLLDVYAGRTPDGLAFFEEHGYFDVSDAINTVQMFRENVAMKEFWDDYDSLDRLDPFERAAVFPFGSKSKVPSNRTRSVLHRTNFERFALQAKDGNSMTEDDLLEMEREYRLKVKILELDDDDEAELETEWLYKRSYWRRPRGELDLRLATKIEMMGHGGFRIEFLSGNVVFMRSRNEREIANWVQLVRFAAEMVRGNAMRCPEISGS